MEIAAREAGPGTPLCAVLIIILCVEAVGFAIVMPGSPCSGVGCGETGKQALGWVEVTDFRTEEQPSYHPSVPHKAAFPLGPTHHCLLACRPIRGIRGVLSSFSHVNVDLKEKTATRGEVHHLTEGCGSKLTHARTKQCL